MSDEVGLDTIDDGLIGDECYCPTCAASFAPLFDRCPDDGTRLIRWRARRDSIAGMVLDGRFQITEQLGQGGMARVYRGIQLSIDRPVAIKVIRKDLSHDRMIAKRFLREARMLTTFNHPNIVNLLELGQTSDDALYLVMELAHGRTLDLELADAGRFDARRTCEVAIQLCDALAAAHAHGIVHRDLKPANIMLSTTLVGRDLVKVLDFGIAKPLETDRRATTTGLTAAGMVMGTPAYISPEAASGDAIDARSDLYALGCILYELLAGAPPFADPAIHMVIARHVADTPPPLPHDVPPQLAQLVYALLEKSPERRPDSATSVHAALRAFLRASAEPAVEAPSERERMLLSLDELPTVPRPPREPETTHRDPSWMGPVTTNRDPSWMGPGTTNRDPTWIGPDLTSRGASSLWPAVIGVAVVLAVALVLAMLIATLP